MFGAPPPSSGGRGGHGARTSAAPTDRRMSQRDSLSQHSRGEEPWSTGHFGADQWILDNQVSPDILEESSALPKSDRLKIICGTMAKQQLDNPDASINKCVSNCKDQICSSQLLGDASVRGRHRGAECRSRSERSMRDARTSIHPRSSSRSRPAGPTHRVAEFSRQTSSFGSTRRCS